MRNLCFSLDPAMRGWMVDRKSYLPPVALGAPMRSATVSRVVSSNDPDFMAGDLVTCGGGWQEFAVQQPKRDGVRKIPPGVSPTDALSIYGMTGLTAYFGMLDVCRPEPGQTVLVSGAAGATGSVAGQIAKIKGCRVVGIAGGPDKCRWLTESAHFDAAIDYKAESVAARVRALCPDGIDAFFDNVGGEALEAALANLARGARIALCGAISIYDTAKPTAGPRNYANLIATRATMRGFLVFDYLRQAPAAIEELSGWVRAGHIVYQVDVQHGFENLPATFLRLFTGANVGKQVLMAAPDED